MDSCSFVNWQEFLECVSQAPTFRTADGLGTQKLQLDCHTPH